MEAIISLLGEDPAREGLAKTPMRSAKALWYLTSGYRRDPSETIRQALFEHEGSKMIIVRDIEYYSMCEHHILPFFGKISIGYIPSGRIIGLSKVARVVDCYARRLQVQERFTAEVCREIAITSGRNSRKQCPASVHENARCREAGFHHHHNRILRRFR